jgi:hypothetical protein
VAIGWIATGAVSAQGGGAGVTSRTTGSVTWSSGDLMVALFSCEDSGAISSLSDTVHSSHTDWTIDTLINGSGPRLQMAWKVATTGGTGTVTVNCTSAPWAEAAVLIGGPPAASPYDIRATNTGSSATPSTGTTATLAQADTWLVAALKVYNNVNFSAWTNSFTERIDGVGLGVAEATVASTTGTGTQATSTVNDAWAGAVWAFKGAASGGTSHTAAVTFSGTGSLSATAERNVGLEAAFSGTGSLAVTAERTVNLAAAFDGAGSLAVTAERTANLAAAFSGAGDLSATVQTGKLLEAAFSGSGDLAVTLGRTANLAAAFTGSGDLAVTASRNVALAAAFSGAGSLEATAGLSMALSVAFAGAGDLTATVDATPALVPQPGGGTTTNPLSLALTTARGGTTTASRGTTSTTSGTRRTSTTAGA